MPVLCENTSKCPVTLTTKHTSGATLKLDSPVYHAALFARLRLVVLTEHQLVTNGRTNTRP